MDLKEISKIMGHIDICMMATHAEDGSIETRPMSNNREVEYDGHSYFFADKSASVYQQLRKDPNVTLAYSGTHSLLNRMDVYISLVGKAELVEDKEQMREHWSKDLDIYFEDGIDTLGIVMIHVATNRIKYWDGENEGALEL